MRNVRPLTVELAREFLCYEQDTGMLRWIKRASKGTRVGDVAGAVSQALGYVIVGLGGGRYYAHRLAWLIQFGRNPTGCIDHINGDKADNRLSNLRDVDYRANAENVARAHRDSRTGVLGVTIDRDGRFMARIKSGHESTYIGRFQSAEEAGDAYTIAKARVHAHSARLAEALDTIGKKRA